MTNSSVDIVTQRKSCSCLVDFLLKSDTQQLNEEEISVTLFFLRENEARMGISTLHWCVMEFDEVLDIIISFFFASIS